MEHDKYRSSEIPWYNHLRLVPLIGPERHAQHEPVQGDDVVRPDEPVHGLDALVDVVGAARLAELAHQDVAERAQVAGQVFAADALKDLEK